MPAGEAKSIPGKTLRWGLLLRIGIDYDPVLSALEKQIL
jgi:hypothetical protein